MKNKKFLVGLALVGGVAVGFSADVPTPDQVKQLKEMGILPSDVIVDEGNDYFHNLKGPNGKTCASCHGQDGAKLVGAYAKMPRYYKDIGKVADIDIRIKACMTKYMGFPNDKKFKKKFTKKYRVPLAGYVATLSNGMKINVTLDDPQEKEMYEFGKKLWYQRVGGRDLSCAICHEIYAGYRIRLQKLGAPVRDKLYAHWPAYRFSKDKLWTMEDRIRGCYKSYFLYLGKKWHKKKDWVKKPPYYMKEIVALELFMKKGANGATIEVPGLLR